MGTPLLKWQKPVASMKEVEEILYELSACQSTIEKDNVNVRCNIGKKGSSSSGLFDLTVMVYVKAKDFIELVDGITKGFNTMADAQDFAEMYCRKALGRYTSLTYKLIRK